MTVGQKRGSTSSKKGSSLNMIPEQEELAFDACGNAIAGSYSYSRNDEEEDQAKVNSKTGNRNIRNAEPRVTVFSI
jgi:hypothetical protein